MLLTGRANAQVGAFDSPTDFSDNFTSTGNLFTYDATHGLSGSGGIATNYAIDLYTANTGIVTTGPGAQYSASVYFLNGANSGMAGIGFAIQTPNDNFGICVPEYGLGMYTHAGGGAVTSNHGSRYCGYDTDILTDGNWYKETVTVTDQGSNLFDVNYEVFSCDATGGNLVLIKDTTITGIVNAEFEAAEMIYPYFANYSQRAEYFDNFEAVAGPLPIQLASLNASAASGSSVTLDWKTASEVNNYGFFVERSSDKKSGFAAVSGLIPGHGTSTTGYGYQFTDRNVPAGTQYYRLKQIDLDNSIHYSDAVMLGATDAGKIAPTVFALSQNFPNPFNPSTEFRFSVAKSGFTTLIVYNLLGQEVSRIFNGETETGKFYTARFDGTGLASGVYFARLQSGVQIQLKKIALMK